MPDLFALAETKLSDLSFVAFDTEATGYSNVSDRLIEVAGVRFRRRDGAWTTEGEFSELVCPGRPIPEETRVIHGITDDLVAHAAGAVEVLDRFFAFAADSLLLVHYAPADVGMMAFAYAREGRGVPAAFALDTFPLSKRLCPGRPQYSLEALARELGLPAASHRALPDALATRALFEHCVAQLGEPEALIVGDLLERTGPPVTLEEFSTLPLTLPEHLSLVDQAIAERYDLTLEYRGGSKGAVPRRVTPSHLFARQGHVFLEGYCHLDREMKSFRLDRIERACRVEAAAS